jgi:hypothetical protein
MIQFTDYIDPLAFFIALGIGLFLTYIYAPAKKMVIKWPTPENAGKVIYKDHSDSCYKYKANEVPCPDDKTQIKNISIQYVDNKKE